MVRVQGRLCQIYIGDLFNKHLLNLGIWSHTIKADILRIYKHTHTRCQSNEHTTCFKVSEKLHCVMREWEQREQQWKECKRMRVKRQIMSYSFYKNYLVLLGSNPPPTIKKRVFDILRDTQTILWKLLVRVTTAEPQKRVNYSAFDLQNSSIWVSSQRKVLKVRLCWEWKRVLNPQNSIYTLKAKRGDLNKFYLNHR